MWLAFVLTRGWARPGPDESLAAVSGRLSSFKSRVLGRDTTKLTTMNQPAPYYGKPLVNFFSDSLYFFNFFLSMPFSDTIFFKKKILIVVLNNVEANSRLFLSFLPRAEEENVNNRVPNNREKHFSPSLLLKKHFF